MSRPTPVELVFGTLVGERFPALRDALRAAGRDERNRDAFVLAREAVELLRDLSPDGGMGETIEELVAFVHAAFLHWLDGEAVVEVELDTLARLLRDPPPAAGGGGAGPSYYLQLPARRVWGEPLAGAPPEPLDGCFVRSGAEATLDAVAVFGLQPARAGLTTVRVAGGRPDAGRRPDGSAPFEPRLEGGVRAGLFSVASQGELLDLVHRCDALLGRGRPRPGRQRVGLA
jgi:hypothetical protein